jgi:hypothetical protein
VTVQVGVKKRREFVSCEWRHKHVICRGNAVHDKQGTDA